jgi:hypothetical protein
VGGKKMKFGRELRYKSSFTEMSTDQKVMPSFDLSSFTDETSKLYLQHAIDGANKAVLNYPSAWEFIKAGGLIRANRCSYDGKETDPIAAIVFKEMDQDGHSGSSASWVLNTITWLANGLPEEWKTSGIPAHIRGTS